MTNKLRVASLDYEDIRTSFVNYLKQQDTFSDYNFTASGISVLLDVLAYNAHYQALMANFLANETYIDTAVKRSSIVSRAKELGYVPFSKKSARATVNVSVTNVTGNPSSLIIPANTQFTTMINSKTYSFVTLQSYASQRSYNGSQYVYTFSNVELYEGIYLINRFTFNGVDPTFDIPNIDIDTSTLRVFVDEGGSTPVEWPFAANLLNIDGDTRAYFIQEGFDQKYQIYFGDGVIGKTPETDSVISVLYTATSGVEGNDASTFVLSSNLSGFTGSTVSTQTVYSSSGGRDRETSQSIRLNAVNQYGVQNRAVTASDYKSIIQSSGINIRSAHVWGGEDNTPPKYGYVIVCAQPSIGDFVLESQKATIIALLKSKAVANINIDFVDPEYLDIVLNTEVVYNKNVLDISTYDLETSVLSSIVTYADSEINKFDSTFRYSNLMNEIDRTHLSVLSNVTTFNLQKELTPVLYQSTSYVVNFDNSLNNGLKQSTITSSLFTIPEFANFVSIEDDGNGVLNIVTYTNGVRNYVKRNVGTVDYSTGKVVITSLIVTGYDGFYLNIKAIPTSNDIKGLKNTIVRIKSNNVTVTSRAE